jgi:hemoglobin
METSRHRFEMEVTVAGNARKGTPDAARKVPRIVAGRLAEFCEVVIPFNGLTRAQVDNFVLDHRLEAASMTRILLVACALLATAAIAQSPPVAKPVPLPTVAPAGSLYARLGGTPAVSAFVADTIDQVANGEHTRRSFDKVNLQHVKDMLAEQICSLTGGGCTYSGDTMREVHAGHQITNAEFFELVEVLRAAMRKHDVPLAARNELLEILAPMKRDVVKL